MSDTETQPTARPSLESLDWSDAGSDSTAPEQSSSEASSAVPSAVGEPTNPTTPSQTDEATRDDTGPISRHRLQSILTNERTKHEKALEAERVRQRETFGWLQPYIDAGLNQEHLTYLVQMGSRFAGDKRGFLDALADDPAVQEWVKARAANEATQQATDAEPQPDLLDKLTGEPAYSVSQGRKWAEWNRRQLRGEIDAAIKPFQSEREERIAREAAEAEYHEAEGKAQAIFDRYKTLPHFREHMPAIRAKYVELMQHGIADVGYAYSLVMQDSVLPTLSDAGRTKAITDMKRAAHSGSMNPKTGAPSTPAKKARLEDYDWS